MREVRAHQIGLSLLLAAAVLACGLVTSVPTTGPTTGVQPPQSTQGAPTIAATETPAEAGPPTSVPATPIQGPAIAHLAAGQGFDLGTIRMIDANQGWGIGGSSQAQDHVFRTQSGGQTWRDVTPPEPAPAAGSSVVALGSFMDASNAWVAYGPASGGSVPAAVRVWYTADGGSTWSYGVVDGSSVTQESFVPSYLDFGDAQHGWLLVLLGAGMNHQYSALFATSDGGKTWTDIQDPSTPAEIQSFEKTGMAFSGPQNGWLTRDSQGVDPSPHVITTQDGGVTWTRIELPDPAGTSGWFDQNACGTYAPTPLSAQSMLVILKCVDNATFKVEHDYLYATTDGGQNWHSARLPADFTVADPPAGGLFFSSAQTGLALGRRIYRTDDGGATWSGPKLVNWDGQFSFLDLSTGWAIARNAGQIALVNTSDGGKTWQQIHPTVAP